MIPLENFCGCGAKIDVTGGMIPQQEMRSNGEIIYYVCAHGVVLVDKRDKQMTEREMFEKSFERPRNFFFLPGPEQWSIDKRLGILDWDGKDLTEADKARMKRHYNT
jgi:hypothetical protein